MAKSYYSFSETHIGFVFIAESSNRVLVVEELSQHVGLESVGGGAGFGAPLCVLCMMSSPSGKDAIAKTDAMTGCMLIESRDLSPESLMEQHHPSQWIFCRA